MESVPSEPDTPATDDGVDILVISYRSPEYTRKTLTHLLEGLREGERVWLWQNGSHEGALEVARSFADHPHVHRFHQSEENLFVREPTNWMWSQATGRYFAKVDDDGILPLDWIARLRKAHEDAPELGVVGCWRFLEEDFNAELATPKLAEFPGGHRLLRNLWVEGSGYLMKRECYEAQGLLPPNRGFSGYCIEIVRRGWTNGWYYPFIYQLDLDDPRAAHTLLRSDDDLVERLPLGAQKQGIRTLDGWSERRREAAHEVLASSLDVRQYFGWRVKLRRIKQRLRRWGHRRRGARWNPNW